MKRRFESDNLRCCLSIRGRGGGHQHLHHHLLSLEKDVQNARFKGLRMCPGHVLGRGFLPILSTPVVLYIDNDDEEYSWAEKREWQCDFYSLIGSK